MAHLTTKIAEYGIVFNEHKQFLLLQFSKATNPGEKWIFPGGRLDEHERPKEALVREIKEETGLEAELLFPCDVAMWGRDDDHRYAVFFACSLSNAADVQLSHEHQDYRWCSRHDLDELALHDEAFRDVLRNACSLLERRNQ